ncbi:unnamed protein product, partial [Iphiclides podalirius]
MFYCEEVKEFFKVWANIDVPDGLSIQVCWECLAAVRSAFRFRAQILSAFDVLIDYSRQHTFLNSPSDLSKHATSRLSVTPLDVEPSFHPLKEEEPIHIDVDVIKIEEDVGKYSTIEIDCQKDITAHDQDASDDDIQLSKLKAKKKKGRKSKKEKKEKKQKDSVEHKEAEQALKKSRKLKNLPEDLVELYEMTEEEMWRMRAEDVARKEFVALKYKCNDCIIGFNTEKLMKYHMNGKHVPKSEANVQCDVCKAYFVTRDNVSAHRALHRAAYRCRGCGASTTLKHAMRMHACARGSAPAHACAICDREFSTKSKLTYHRGVCHQERPQCDCCGKVFANKMTLKYHLKILPQNKPKEKLNIPCKGCDKVFHSKKSYRAHVVIHNGLLYPCPIYGKLFHWKRNLLPSPLHLRSPLICHPKASSQSPKKSEKNPPQRDPQRNHVPVPHLRPKKSEKNPPQRDPQRAHVPVPHLRQAVPLEAQPPPPHFILRSPLICHPKASSQSPKKSEKNPPQHDPQRTHVPVPHLRQAVPLEAHPPHPHFILRSLGFQPLNLLPKKKKTIRPSVITTGSRTRAPSAASCSTEAQPPPHPHFILSVIHNGLTYPCPICGKLFHWKRNLPPTPLHSKEPTVIHNGLTYPCPICGKLFHWKRNLPPPHFILRSLGAHVSATLKLPPKAPKKTKTIRPSVIHNGLTYPCPICGKLVIHNGLTYPCPICGKLFHWKRNLPPTPLHSKEPTVIHNGLTYPCPICGKLFHWKRNLARHTRNHRERDAGALHQCRDCGKSFSSRDCYNNHMRLSKRHVSEDAYVHACNYCGKKFATKWCMVDHIDWDHLKLIKYQCNVCFV